MAHSCRRRHGLPEKLQRHLDVTRIVRRRADLAELRRAKCCARQRKLRVVEGVEKLRPELQLPLLIKTEGLEHGEVPVVDAWPDHGIAALVADTETRRRDEGPRVEP